jgi:predicted metal-dependent enzyme (double-stranded beta helix superfamily)
VDLDRVIGDLVDASDESTPQLAIRDALERAVADADQLAARFPCERAELVPLHVSSTLSVFKAIWAPGMTVPPHDHRMWGAIGVFAGREDNEFFRRAEGGLATSGGKTLLVGDVGLMGDDVIHSVTATGWTGALHVYGGDFMSTQRSIWIDGDEQPNDGPRTQAIFEAANQRLD